MADVKRLDITGTDYEVYEHDEGDYVHFDDYAATKEKLLTWIEKASELDIVAKRAIAERDAALAEVDRLKQAIDQNDIAWAKAAVPQIAKSENQSAEITRLKACIDAMAETCGKDKQRIAELEADLARQNKAIRNMGEAC